jgi:hypothetical protein
MINLEHLFWYVTHSISNGLWNLFLNLYLDLLEFETNFNFNFSVYTYNILLTRPVFAADVYCYYLHLFQYWPQSLLMS